MPRGSLESDSVGVASQAEARATDHEPAQTVRADVVRAAPPVPPLAAHRRAALEAPGGAPRAASSARDHYLDAVALVAEGKYRAALEPLTAAVYVSTSGGAPAVTVSDAKGNAVAAEVLLNDGASLIVQVREVKANATYFVAVRAANPAQWTEPERYALGINFRTEPVAFLPVASGTLADGQQFVRGLEVRRSQAFRFQLTASDPAGGGQVVVGDALLAPGSYTVTTVGLGAVGAQFLPTTDPIGPALDDGSASPTPAAAPGTSTTTTGYDSCGFFWSSEPQRNTAPSAYGYAIW